MSPLVLIFQLNTTLCTVAQTAGCVLIEYVSSFGECLMAEFYPYSVVSVGFRLAIPPVSVYVHCTMQIAH